MRMRIFAGAFLGLAVGLARISLAALPDISRPAGPQGGSTEVRIHVVLVDVDEIDSVAQNFVANFYFEAQWRDPRLAHDGPAKMLRGLTEVWHPRFQFVNQQKIWPTFPEVAEIAPDGTVTYRQRIWGPFSQPLLLHDFPFDRQSFEIRIVAVAYTPEEVRFVLDPDRRSGLAPKFSQPDWEILGWKFDTSPYDPLGGADADASFALVFTARRQAGYFIFQIILPLALVVAMSWIVFWIDPAKFDTQIGVATTTVLTLVAYRFVVGALMPNISYLTRMDYFLFGSTLLVFAALLQAVVTATLARAEKIQTARRIDLWCRWLCVPLFAAVIWYAFVF